MAVGDRRRLTGVRERDARGGEALRRSQLAEIQRARLIAGAVCAVDEFGYAQATVGHITARASVSRRTFYELFSNREECMVAVLEDLIARVDDDFASLDLGGLAWSERIRVGLGAILALFDREPVLARVCVVHASRGGPRVLERREEILAVLAAALDEGRKQSARASEPTTLTAEGLVGAAFAIVQARLLRRERTPLVDLLGELMGMIVLPYLGPAAARREQNRPTPRTSSAGTHLQDTVDALGGGDPLRGTRVRLTYRTARVLEGVGQMSRQGSDPSNRMVGEYAGVGDAGQISKLLARLERAGLLVNRGAGHSKGEPNAWSLTPKGETVVRSIGLHPHGERVAA